VPVPLPFATPLHIVDPWSCKGTDVAELHTVFTGLISGLGLVVPGVYFVGRLVNKDHSRDRALWAKLDLPEAYDRRRRRRSLGMAMMAVISVVFFVGANYMNPRLHPDLALLFWIVLLLLLVWLCVLAMIDLAEVRRLRRRLLGAARQLLREEMTQCDPMDRTQNDEQR